MFTRKENSNDAEFQPYIERDEDVQYSTSQMIYHVETISAGTPFYWKVVLEDVTSEEFDFFLSVIQKFKNIPVVGGKSATGFGQIEFEDISWRDITKDGDILTDVEETTESLYVNFVKNNKNGIKAYLKMI
jgi:CRISPR/Cas system CSM-associated protein Csm3 (group 7 of RAMP superfamily)